VREGKYPSPAPCSHSVLSKGDRDWGALVKVTVQGYRFTKRQRPNHRNIDCFPSPKPYHYILNGLFAAIPFIQYILYIFQEKNYKTLTRHGG
jgi:hypothetical protein